MTPAVERLKSLARAYSTVRVGAVAADRGLTEEQVVAAARSLGLETFARAGVLWVLLSARRTARDKGER